MNSATANEKLEHAKNEELEMINDGDSAASPKKQSELKINLSRKGSVAPSIDEKMGASQLKRVDTIGMNAKEGSTTGQSRTSPGKIKDTDRTKTTNLPSTQRTVGAFANKQNKTVGLQKLGTLHTIASTNSKDQSSKIKRK